MIRAWAQALFLLALGLGNVQAEVAVPPLKARVTDLTATLSREQQARLEQELQNFEAKKGSQLAVLIVPTTQPETIEQYGIRVVDSWKLGRKGVDDGALLLIAKNDRNLRIEVGYGLEGALNDATAKRIVSDIIVPHFKAGDFYGGIEAGIQSMMKVIEGEPLPPPQRSRSTSSGSSIHSLFLIAFILVMVAGGWLRALFGRLPAATVIGMVLGILVWLLIASLTLAIFLGAIGFLFTLMSGGSRGWYGGPGGYSSGGFGGGFSGGGFSGGGGGFGGGGASGSW